MPQKTIARARMPRRHAIFMVLMRSSPLVIIRSAHNDYDMASADIAFQHGKRAIITGANSGIGYYTAATLARHGADVVLA
jgi:hypothetical protein